MDNLAKKHNTILKPNIELTSYSLVVEFTKIGLIDFINQEEEEYYGDSYDYQTEPIEYDILFVS